MPDHFKSIARGTIITYTAKIFYTACAFVFSVTISRLYGPEIMGQFFLCVTVVSIITIFAKLGTSRGLLKFLSVYNTDKKHEYIKGSVVKTSFFVFALSVVFAFALFLLAGFVAEYIFNDSKLTVGLRIFSCFLPFYALRDIIRESLKALKKVWFTVLTETYVFYGILFILLFAMYFVTGKKLSGLALSHTTAVFIAVVFGAICIIHSIPNFFVRETRDEFARILTYSLPLLFVSVSGLLMGWLDIFMLGVLRSSADVGIYAAANRIAHFVAFLLVAVNYINPPIFASLYHQGKKEELEYVARNSARWILALSLPLAVIFIMLSRTIMNIYGPTFLAGGLALIFLSVAQLVNVGAGSVGFLLMMTGNQKTLAFLTMLSALVNGILNFLLIPKLGITGAGLATAISVMVLNVLMTVCIYVKIKIKSYPYKLRYIIVPAVLSIAVFLFMRERGFQYLGIGVFLLVYTFGLFIFNRDDVKTFMHATLRSRRRRG